MISTISYTNNLHMAGFKYSYLIQMIVKFQVIISIQ